MEVGWYLGVFFRGCFLEGAISEWHRALSTPCPCLKVFSSVVVLLCFDKQEAWRDCKGCIRQKGIKSAVWDCWGDGMGWDGWTS